MYIFLFFGLQTMNSRQSLANFFLITSTILVLSHSFVFFLLLSHKDCFYWFFANSLSENFIWLLSLSNVLGTHNQTENFFFFTSLLHSENKGNRTKVELFYIETILLVIIVIIVNWLITYRAFRIEYFKLFVNLFI